MLSTSVAARRALIPLAAAVAVALSGCGGSKDASSTTQSGGDNSDAGRVKLTQCLRDNGVDVPDNVGSSGARPSVNIDQNKLQAAVNGPCKKYQSGAFGNVTDASRQDMQDAFQAFSQCMRDQGVDVPNINPGGGGSPPAGSASINQDDPKVQSATKACQSKLPKNLPGGGGQ